MGDLTQKVLVESHNSWYSINPRATIMYRYLEEVFWWNDMNRDIEDFSSKFPYCQQVQLKQKKPGGMTQDINILTWKWEVTNMDFTIVFPRTHRQHDSIRVMVDIVTKSSHSLVFKTTDSVEVYAKIYINDIFKFHGVLLFIISDRIPQFTSNFWKSFRKVLVPMLILVQHFIRIWMVKQSIPFTT